MKITETIERECCQPDDLVKYQASFPKCHPLPVCLHFCKYCGQWWHGNGRYERKMIIVTHFVIQPIEDTGF